MISLKKFLSTDNEAERALLHAVQTLIQGIARHGASGEAAAFHGSLDQVMEAMQAEITPEDLLVHVGVVVKALEDHHREFDRRRGQRDSEYQNMVKMLTATVAAISTTGSGNVERLAEIEKQVISASELDDVRLIKSRLADCLHAIRTEADRQRKETAETIERLREAAENGTVPAAPTANDPDPVTRLPQRPAAEKALCDAGQNSAHNFAAVLVLDRLQALNLRFGRSIGDEVLSAFSKSVEKKLSPGDRLFRWGGPALVALISHAGNIEQARGDISRIVDAKLEHNIETDSRSILVPIGARWAVFPMMAAPRLLYKRIDTFASVMTRE